MSKTLLNIISTILSFAIIAFAYSCKNPTNKCIINDDLLFSKVNSVCSGIDFNNKLHFTKEYNPYTFKNFFNGGGVAIGDINNDGLADIYFSGSLVGNKLYLNQGDFVFNDITESSGTSCADVWSTGISMVDVNMDGLLDIYVCKSGKPDVENRKNELFINNGDLTFTDKAEEYGLDFLGLSTQAAFFDYDLDGDLDCYLLNNSIRSVGAYDIAEGLRDRYDNEGGNMLLRNEYKETGNILFKDVSKEAGIYGSAIGFGLGVSVSDLNFDGWPDIYVSNDFFEKDYFYLNQKNGTFKESIDESFREISMGAMGADIADLNGDELPDIFVTEMLPETLERFKSKATFETIEKSELNYIKGYHRQFGRNTLNIHKGIYGEGIPQFAEISRMSGVYASEWSWGALINDFNNDGLNDIFVANGIFKDLLDLDYINFFNPSTIKGMIDDNKDVVSEMMSKIPTHPVENKLYINKSNLEFEDKALEWGLSDKTYSNGSAYADLDNDGDLDLIVNNIDSKAGIYKNNSKDSEYKQIFLRYLPENQFAIGSKITLFTNKGNQIREVFPFKGFQSALEYRQHFGIPDGATLDSLIIQWPNNKKTTIKELTKNIIDTIDYFQSDLDHTKFVKEETTLPIFIKQNTFDVSHTENNLSDFTNERLRIFTSAANNPKLKIDDFNKDNLDDIVISSSKGKPLKIYYQNRNGNFDQKEIESSIATAGENQDILIIDANDDTWPDLLVVNGGSEQGALTSGAKNVLLINNRGNFTEANDIFRSGFTNNSCACLIDLNNDGAKDVFFGGYINPKAYGIPQASKIFISEGGEFVDKKNPLIDNLGIITDCTSGDITGNGQDEIVLSTEWGTLRVLSINSDGELIEITNDLGLDKSHGLWSSVKLQDINNDEKLDILATNLGLNNSLYQHGEELMYFVNDFDSNGTIEGILCSEKNGIFYPLHLRNEIVTQIPVLKKKFLTYESYSKASMSDMFSDEILQRSITYKLNEPRSGAFINNGSSFEFNPFPKDAQESILFTIETIDFNQDGLIDVIAGGNCHGIKPEYGMCNSSYGVVLENLGDGFFKSLPISTSGINETDQVRDIDIISIKNQRYVIFAKNDSKASFYKLKTK